MYENHTLIIKQTKDKEEAFQLTKVFTKNNLDFTLKEPNPFSGETDYVIYIAPENLGRATSAMRPEPTNNDGGIQKKAADKNLILAGYLGALIGGVFGILLGMLIMMSKTLTPQGIQYFTYDDASRKQGKMMVIIGAACLFIILLIKNMLERDLSPQ
ncbi:MAG: hypothetical protein NTX03_08745 [Bacteroidetes bacterium]|nr:hypothetical protein [Bacteroidota bacterium]